MPQTSTKAFARVVAGHPCGFAAAPVRAALAFIPAVLILLAAAPESAAQKQKGSSGKPKAAADTGGDEVDDDDVDGNDADDEDDSEGNDEQDEHGGEGDGDGDEVGGGDTAKKPSKKGRLVVKLEGDEDAKVFVDGIDVGETPWEDDLLPGEYKISVKAPGVPSWKGKAKVETGKSTVVSVDPEGTKKVPGTSTAFWSLLGAAIPSLTVGIVLAAVSKSYNDKAVVIADKLDAGIYAADPVLEAQKIQRQHDLVSFRDGMQKGAIAGLVVGGVLAAGAIAAIFIFRKEKTASVADIEVSSIAPFADPATGTLGLDLSLSF